MNQDGTVTPTDATVPSEATPAPSAPEAKTTFTLEEVTQLVNERHSTLDKKLADAQREIDLGKMAGLELQDAKAKLATLDDSADTMLSKAEGGVDVVAERQKVREAQRLLNEQKTKQDWEWLDKQDLIKKADDMAKLATFSEVAKEYNVDVNKLMMLPCDSAQSIRTSASVLAAAQAPVTPMAVDSATTTSGGGMSWEETVKAYASGHMSHESFGKARAAHKGN